MILPWGTHGYRNLGSASTYANRKVTVIGSHGSYRLIQIPGGKVLGWVDERAIRLEGAARLLEEAAKYIDVIKNSPTHRQMVNAYNRGTPLSLGYTLQVSDDWCDAFVTYIGDKLGISSLIGRECGVERHKNIFRQKESGKDSIRIHFLEILLPSIGGTNDMGMLITLDLLSL